jgi:hypothetical protein
VEFGGVDQVHAPFLKEGARVVFGVQLGRKSGYAPVEMTNLLRLQFQTI